MEQVAIYLRLSDEDRNKKFKNDESESIQNQKSMLREYCIERNWSIYDIYSDEDYSGIDKNRPEFNRMLRDCESGEIDIVLCKSQSRFSRDMEMIEKYIHNKFLEWGVRFVSIVDHADSNDASNKKARQINGLINEWYLEDVSDNIRKTLKHKREQGEFTGSFAPYGYFIDPENKNHLIIDEYAADVVRKVFSWYVQGWGYRRIVIELNTMGVLSPTAYKHHLNSKFVNTNGLKSSSKGLWTHTTIYKMIRNETYTGTLVQGKSHSVSYKNKKRISAPPDEWIRVYNTHEPIIDADIWEKAQDRIKSRTRISKVTKELSPLAGKVKCAICGRAMKRNVYHNKNKTKTYYVLQCATYKTGAMNCSNVHTISGTQLESAILEQLNHYIKQYCQMDEIELTNHQTDMLRILNSNLESNKSKITNCEAKMLSLYEDKIEGVISKDQYMIFSKKYNDEIDSLRAKSERIEQKISECNNSVNSLDRKKILEKYTVIKNLTRNVVDEFIDCVWIGKRDSENNRVIKIDWNF